MKKRRVVPAESPRWRRTTFRGGRKWRVFQLKGGIIMKFGSSIVGIAALLLVTAGGWSYAQHHMEHQQMQHQQMDMQGNMSQMNSMMQHMSDMMTRSHGLSQTLSSMMKDHHGRMGNQAHMMQQMSQSMETMAKQMKSNMELCNEMLQDKVMMENHTMQQQMGSYQEHMSGMAKQMNGALDNLEAMSKELGHEKTGK
jgi:methyl-accepting chemotaxis protein